MMTTREQLIGWAHYCDGRAGGNAGHRLDAEYDRARAMLETVDEATRTPAERIRFYLRFAQRWPHGSPRARWRALHHAARRSNRFGEGDGTRERFLEQLVFELTLN